MKKLLIIILTAFCFYADAQDILVVTQKKKNVASSSLYLNVNLYDSAGNIGKCNLTGWNDWSISLATTTTCTAYSTYFKWSDNSQSTIRARIIGSDLSSCVVPGYVDNGASYASTETCPDFQQIHFRSSPYITQNNQYLQLAGLPDNAANGYKLIILCTRSTATSRPVSFSANGVSGSPASVEAMNNYATEIIIDNITPVSNGITVTMGFTNGFTFVEAFILIKK